MIRPRLTKTKTELQLNSEYKTPKKGFIPQYR